MRNVNISLSPPAAYEEDGRKAPGPVKQISTVVSTRLGAELASALNSKATGLGLSQSSAAKEAIEIYTRKSDVPQSRRERGAILGELVQLRAQLIAMSRIYKAQTAKGREPDATILKAWLDAYRAVESAAERIST